MKITDLPEILQELIELIGMAETMLIIKAFPGESVYIPRNPDTCTLLRKAGLSQESIVLLCERFPSDRIDYIPKYGKIVLRLRDDAIRRRHEAGATVASIAKEFGLVRRRIHQILAEPVDDLDECLDQISLF